MERLTRNNDYLRGSKLKRIKVSHSISQRASIWLICAMLVSATQLHAQIYRPIANNNMWDSYLFKDGAKYHLFYLQNENYPRVEKNRASWLLASVGRAVSTDLVNWKTLPPINFQSYKNEHADKDRMFIGQMIAKMNGEYYFFFDPRPRTFGAGSPTEVLVSRDLQHWSQRKREPVLRKRPPHYGGGSWRDLFLSYDKRDKLWHGYLCAETLKRNKRPVPLSDMTIVVWLNSPAKQRNGGVLSVNFADSKGKAFETLLIDQQRRWSVISEQNRQLVTPDLPVETAGMAEQVAIAMVYQRGSLRLYRNGKLYSQYKGLPQKRRDILNVTMGRISWRKGGSSVNHFVGAIDEVRIYQRALAPKAVAELKRGQPKLHAPHPMAAWTFDDTTAADSMGTFIMPEMNLGAKIENGRLMLDGRFAHLYQTAISTPGMACIGHVTSPDLKKWDYHPPIYASKRFCNMECPDYFQMGDWHYFLFSTVRTRMDTSGRKDASGTYYIMSRSRKGPYHLPKQPLLFGSGRGRMDNYVGRTIQFGKERLLYYHTVHGNIADCIAKPVTWGAAKRFIQHRDGTLSLAYWQGLDKLHAEQLYALERPIHLKSSNQSIHWLRGKSFNDATITGKISVKNGIGGVVWRFDKGNGRALLIDPRANSYTIATLQGKPKGDLKSSVVDDYFFQDNRQTHDVRITLRSHRADVYVNKKWVFSTSVIDAPLSGKIGLYANHGSTHFENLKITKVNPLKTPVLPTRNP